MTVEVMRILRYSYPDVEAMEWDMRRWTHSLPDGLGPVMDSVTFPLTVTDGGTIGTMEQLAVAKADALEMRRQNQWFAAGMIDLMIDADTQIFNLAGTKVDAPGYRRMEISVTQPHDRDLIVFKYEPNTSTVGPDGHQASFEGR